MQLLLQIVLLIGTVSFAAAVYFGTVAFHEARPKFPLRFQDEPTARYAMDTLVRHRPVSNSTRRKYLTSVACLAIAAACAAFGFAIHGSLAGAIGFGGVFVLAMSFALARFMKHRDAF
ncbi:MAG: hypothetical protein K2Z80_14750 [Xanthobacteraceae bacterium]|nr:hypothetical protein [Xanthobacteraceae bacterium]